MGRQQAFGGLVGQAWSTGKPLFSPGTGKKNPNRMRVGISHYGGSEEYG